VPKPASAGSARTAIAITQGGFINIRNGPSTRYRDVGDLLRNTIVAYYPASRTGDGWVWVEQFGRSGWVSLNVVSFEDIDSQPPTTRTPTPYDGRIGLWHWRGDSIAENTIDELAQNIKRYAPLVKAIMVKTSDWTPTTGAQWMGFWDSKRNLAIDGPASIDRWVSTLARYGLEFHAWCVPRGGDPIAESSLIVQACLRPGVRSMILDVEPYDGYWIGGQAGVRPFMTRVRRAIPGAFHVGMTVDPRSQHYESIYPLEWFPFVNSIHPQTYWEIFRDTPEEALAESYGVWGNYGRPIIPLLQGDADVRQMQEAHVLATQRHKATGVSWWRIGVMGAAELQAINQPISISTPPTQPPPSNGYDAEIVINPQNSSFSIFSYTGQQEFQSFAGTWGWTVYYKQTEAQRSRVAASWTPKLQRSGNYEISAFIPSRNASTRNARYKIHGVRGSRGELVVSVNQQQYRNGWATLGVFDIDANAINAGTVFLNDLTGESGFQIAFDAVRWRHVADGTLPPGTGSGGIPLADGFDSPVGTADERRSNKVWPGDWLDASPFGQLYFIGTPAEAYHTGADLNRPADRDRLAPVYACASGVVIFAASLPVWGNVIIIKHDPLTPGGTVMYSRSAHVENMQVRVGDRVTRGQQISLVGNASGRFAYHLHFDLSPTTILETNPEHWPARKRDELFRHYIDPRVFIQNNRPRR
jgi:murein DD-endopeptidase MepM/ murein hydrolase activator NlpD